MTRSRRRVVALVAAALLVLTGCRADVTVAVDVGEDGAGEVEVTVALDAEAVARTEGLDELRTDDLLDAGWTVAEPVSTDDGGLVLSASKPFVDPADLTAVLREVSGPAGPYAQLGLAVDRPFARTDLRFEGVLDGTVGVEAFADPAVAAALDGLPFGTDLAALEAELGAPAGSFVGLELVVSMPGDPVDDAEATGALADDGTLRWSTDLAADAPVPVLAVAEVERTQPLVLLAVAALLVGLLVLLLVARLVVGLRRRRRRRRAARQERRRAAEVEPLPDDEHVRVVEPGPVAVGEPDLAADEVAEGAAAATGAAGGASSGLQMVVIGGPGTAFGVRDEVDELVAFARSQGSLLEYPKIADRHAAASRGSLSTSELWEALGVPGDAAALDAEFLGRYQLTPGLREFVVRARDRGYRVAYLGDGPAAWAAHLRRSFRLDELVDPWVVSADIGAVLPSIAMFEGLRRIATVDPPNCLVIDDRLRVLEAARELGYGTAWFTPSGRATEAPGHSIIRGFADLLSG